MEKFVPLIVSVLALALVLGVTIVLLARRRERGAHAGPPGPGREPARDPVGVLTVADLERNYERAAFLPRTRLVEGDDEELGSRELTHFGGRPWLPDGTPWPVCGICSKPMHLLLQLDLDALPDGAPPQRAGGLLQVFSCAETEACAEAAAAGAPYSRAHLARVVSRDPSGGVADRKLGPRTGVTHEVIGWDAKTELPQLAELEAAADVMTEEVLSHLAGDRFASSSDKLGGWPFWTRAVAYPRCPECDARMEFIFQVASGEHVRAGLGGDGVGHVMRCATHSTRIAFVWTQR